METIKLTYNFDGSSIGETKNITLTKTDEHGIHDYEVCELFMDFMKSAGYSEENIIKWFKGY